MKEIRLHGRGGQGVVKSSQIVVKAAVDAGSFGQFIPFFGVERKGSPVYGYLRLDSQAIRRKMQVYEPEILLIFDDTLISMEETYAGVRENSLVVINTKLPIDKLMLPSAVSEVAALDATGIALETIGRSIPNTAMLGAFAKAAGLVDKDILFKEISSTFGEKNMEAAKTAYEKVSITKL